jgi:membrane associated rhomboid family serine protease
MSFIRDIQMQFGQATALYRLMAINIAVFLVLMLIRTIMYLVAGDTQLVTDMVGWLSLPASPAAILYQPWGFLTYMFLHQDIMHILFNMLILYWTGKLFTEYLGNEKLWGTYVLGAITGAVLYVLAFNLFPAFEAARSTAYLLGASAGVIAILVAIATLLPDYTVHLLIFGAVRLKYLAIVSILLYFISIPLGNAGGHIAHLGGALFGFVMVKQLRAGRDLTSWLTGLGNRKRKVPMKVVSRGGRLANSDEQLREQAIATQEMVDQILDKINKSGFDSLSKQEKEILYKASGKK